MSSQASTLSTLSDPIVILVGREGLPGEEETASLATDLADYLVGLENAESRCILCKLSQKSNYDHRRHLLGHLWHRNSTEQELADRLSGFADRLVKKEGMENFSCALCGGRRVAYRRKNAWIHVGVKHLLSSKRRE